MKKVISTKNMSHEDWLKWRQKGIGGSDCAAIVGLSPWGSGFSVYCDKVGLTDAKEDNEAMKQGRDLEEYVAQRFTEATGKKVKKLNYLLCHDDYPFMQANIDREVVGEKAGLECKTMNPRSNHVDGLEIGDIPPNYYCQIQHYLAVTGYKKWYLAILVLGSGFFWFEVPRNENDIKTLINAEKEFWETYVIPRVPPAPDGSKATEIALKGAYKYDNGEQVELNDLQKKLDRRKEIKRAQECLENELRAIENELKGRMGDNAYGSAESWRISYKTQERTSIDTKRLKAEHPEIDFAQYEKHSSYRTLRVNEVKKNDEY